MHILLSAWSTAIIAVSVGAGGLGVELILLVGWRLFRRRRIQGPLCICGHPLLYADDAGILNGHMRGTFDPEEGGRCLNDTCTGGPEGGPCPKYHEKV